MCFRPLGLVPSIEGSASLPPQTVFPPPGSMCPWYKSSVHRVARRSIIAATANSKINFWGPDPEEKKGTYGSRLLWLLALL